MKVGRPRRTGHAPFKVRDLKAGDPRAWTNFVQVVGSKIAGYALRMGAPDPDDIMSATMEILARRIGSFEGSETQLRSFAFTIAHGRIVDALRQKTRRNEVPFEDRADVISWTEPSEMEFVDSQLLGALSELSAEQRQMIDLRYVVGLSTKETAEVIGKSEVATRVALSRAQTKLKLIMQRLKKN